MHPNTMGREMALQYLYMHDMRRGTADSFETFSKWSEPPMKSDVVSFAGRLVAFALSHRDEIDADISRVATHWRVARMPAIDRNVMRLAMAEMLSEQTPQNVVIDEALDLARKYGTPESPKFVNGIIDKIAKKYARPKIEVAEPVKN